MKKNSYKKRVISNNIHSSITIRRFFLILAFKKLLSEAVEWENIL